MADLGRKFAVALVAAGVTALGFVFTVLDFGDKIGSPNRRYYAVFWFVAFVVSLFIAGRKLYRRVDVLENQIEQMSLAAPSIRFQRVGGPTDINLTKRSKEIWQLWFVNDPAIRSSAAVAKHLTAEVEFVATDGQRPFEPFVGQWALTQKPDHVGWADPDSTKPPHVNIRNEIDLGLSPVRGKLMLIGQDDDVTGAHVVGGNTMIFSNVFALSGENIHAKPAHFEHSKYRLDKSINRVRVRLAAENMQAQEFHFAIARDDIGKVQAITQIMP
jgi:hypothetical protein